jgi:hypothetical protein
MTAVAIHQPNYLPWLGFFAKLAAADTFIVLDDAQLPGGASYVNRVTIAGRGDPVALTVPTSSSLGQAINEARHAGNKWRKKHLGTLQARYARAPFYKEVSAMLAPAMQDQSLGLAALNTALIKAVAAYLGLSPTFHTASDIGVTSTSTQRLVDLIGAVGGTAYISGQGGTNYQDPALFEAAGIDLQVHKYAPLPYTQIFADEFVPGLSVVDALFNLGQDARDLLFYPA